MAARRPYRPRFESIALNICWAGLMELDIADKLTLIREAATDVAIAAARSRSPSDKLASGVVSLRTAAEILGRSPTKYEYRRMQVELPELGLMPDATLRRAFGGESWNRCLERSLLETVSDGDFVTRGYGDSFDEDELVAAVRAYMGEHENRVPTYSEYLAWARSPTVRTRPGRRPLSNGPFARFGGFRTVLARNGILAVDQLTFDVQGRVLPLAWRFSDEELIAGVNEATRRIGEAASRGRLSRSPGAPSRPSRSRCFTSQCDPAERLGVEETVRHNVGERARGGGTRPR